jgi:hypothetical protein
MTRLASLVVVSALILAAPALHARVQEPPLFVPGPGVPVGPGSGPVVLADVNRDGHVDLISKHLLRRLVQVRLGNGRGEFPAAGNSSLRLRYQPGAIRLGDLDEDGSLDLVVARRDQAREYIHVFRGNGKGRFTSAAGAAWEVKGSFEFYKPTIRLADVNEDGKLDIVTSNGRRNTIEILLGNGRGSFAWAPGVTLQRDQDIHTFEPGDVDGDALVDLVVVTRTASGMARLTVLHGSGDGTFTPDSSSRDVLPGGRVGALADLNRDRHLDLVLVHARSNRLSVLLNSGRGTFAPASNSPYRLPAEAFAVVVADVNRDRKQDLVATMVDAEATGFAGRVAVLLSDGRKFIRASGSPFRSGPGAYELAVGDVNGDGKLDVATSSFEGREIGILLGR